MLRLLLISLLFERDAVAAKHRISAEIVDLGQVNSIKMVVGMVTIVEIPGNVTGVRCGNPAAVNYIVPESPKNEVTLVLKERLPRPTNLIIRSGPKVYVFDILPSESEHQDLIRVTGSFGGPVISPGRAKLIRSSTQRNRL